MFTRISTPCSRLLLLSIRCLDRKGSVEEVSPPFEPTTLHCRLSDCLSASLSVCRQRYILLQESIRGRESNSIRRWPSRRVVLTRAMRLGASLVDRGKKNPSKEPPKPANQPASTVHRPKHPPHPSAPPPGGKGIAERPPAHLPLVSRIRFSLLSRHPPWIS